MAARLNSRDLCALKSSEVALLEAVAKTRLLNEAAEVLGVSHRTARNRMAEIREKLFVTSTDQAVAVWKEQWAR